MSRDPSSHILHVAKGTLLFREGDSGDDMYFIHAGKVRIEKEMAGKTEVLAVLEKGDFFGEMSLLDHVPRTATALIEEDAELLKINAANFQKLLEKNAEVAVRMFRKYTARLREANAKLQAVLKDQTEMDKGIQEILSSVKVTTQPKPTARPLEELAVLVGEEKETGGFVITKSPVLIGRQDPVTNLVPDIDLTAADPERTVSRRHARLLLVDGQFLLVEEPGVQNGTFLNGKKIVPGQPLPLQSGDQIRFGSVSFRFQAKNLDPRSSSGGHQKS